MKLTFFAIIILLGLVMPLLWITGTVPSIIYFFRHRTGKTRNGPAATLNPHLGLTMADGGDPMGQEDEPSAAVRLTGTSQGSSEPIPRKPISEKMFWWGGYY
jgi:hypothetical protein